MEQSKTRDNRIDFMKGFAIICMVMGHAEFPGTRFLYLFHMPVFFMISGYLWNDKNSEDLQHVKFFMIRKLKSLWWPFVQWNLIVLLCNNLFVALHFYTTNQELAFAVGNLTYHPVMKLKDMAIPFLKTFLFRTDMELGGATWFLSALFIVSLGHCLLRWLCMHIKLGNTIFCIICIGVMIYVQILCMGIHIPLHFMITRAGFAYWPFLLGYWMKKYRKVSFSKKAQLLIWTCACFILIAGFMAQCTIDVGGAHADNLLIFTIMSISGWFFCSLPCQWCSPKFRDFIAYLGKNSLSIMLYHLLGFKAVSWLYVMITDSPLDLVASFPVIVPAAGNLWVPYTISGIALALLCGALDSRIKQRFFTPGRKKGLLESTQS